MNVLTDLALCLHASNKLHSSVLVKKVVLTNGAEEFYPLKVDCYNSVKEKLGKMLQRDGFLQLCESWPDHQTVEGHLCGIVDGQVWKDFQTVGDEPFLSAPWNYLFMLNFDFFRPIKHRNFFAELQLSPLLFPCCFLLLRWFFFLDSWPKRPQQSFFHNALTKPFQS